MTNLTPEEPSDAGVPERVADASREEGARVLGDQARDRLAGRGFTEEQIREWAEAYIATEGSGTVEGLLAWIAEKERGQG
jgi:hypothetical protein